MLTISSPEKILGELGDKRNLAVPLIVELNSGYDFPFIADKIISPTPHGETSALTASVQGSTLSCPTQTMVLIADVPPIKTLKETNDISGYPRPKMSLLFSSTLASLDKSEILC